MQETRIKLEEVKNCGFGSWWLFFREGILDGMRVGTGMRYWNLKILVTPVNLTNCYKMVTTLRVQALFPTLHRIAVLAFITLWL